MLNKLARLVALAAAALMAAPAVAVADSDLPYDRVETPSVWGARYLPAMIVASRFPRYYPPG